MKDFLTRYWTAVLDIAAHRADRSNYDERQSLLIWALLSIGFVTLVVCTIYGAGTEPTKAIVKPLALVAAAVSALLIVEYVSNILRGPMWERRANQLMEQRARADDPPEASA
jgi:peptidoglycan/LPS O-acetylase OafA/YrhL